LTRGSKNKLHRHRGKPYQTGTKKVGRITLTHRLYNRGSTIEEKSSPAEITQRVVRTETQDTMMGVTTSSARR